jgi:integrase
VVDPETGKSIRKTWYGPNEAEARRKMQDGLVAYRQGEPVRIGRELTLRAWYHEWIKQIQVRPRTLLRYKGCMAHPLDVFGDRPLSAITPALVSGLIRTLHRKGAPTTRGGRPLKSRGANRVRDVLRNCLQDAVRAGKVTRNAAALAKPVPEDDVEEMQVLQPASVARFLELAAQAPDGNLWVFSLATGARLGECQGLMETEVMGYDVDFKDVVGVAKIRREISRVERQWLIEPPKSKRGRRNIRLPAAAIEALRREKARQAELRRTAESWPATFEGTSTMGEPPSTFEGFFFLAENGQPRNPTTVSDRLKAAMRRAGIDPMRFHDLRHSAGTWQIASQVPVAEVSKNLGHSRYSTTWDFYIHALESQSGLAAEAMDRVLRVAPIVSLTLGAAVAALVMKLSERADERVTESGWAAMGRLLELVRQRFRDSGDATAEAALARVQDPPTGPTQLATLAAVVDRCAGADAEFAEELRNLVDESESTSADAPHVAEAV